MGVPLATFCTSSLETLLKRPVQVDPSGSCPLTVPFDFGGEFNSSVETCPVFMLYSWPACVPMHPLAASNRPVEAINTSAFIRRIPPFLAVNNQQFEYD
jgi:hypothetical protein